MHGPVPAHCLVLFGMLEAVGNLGQFLAQPDAGLREIVKLLLIKALLLLYLRDGFAELVGRMNLMNRGFGKRVAHGIAQFAQPHHRDRDKGGG